MRCLAIGWRLLTPRVGIAPENNGTVLVGWVAQYFVELHGEAVEMADVQWAEVAMERIVEQRLVDAEVDRWERLGPRCPLGGRLALLGVGKWRGCIRRVCVGC